jgi:cation transport ATPase
VARNKELTAAGERAISITAALVQGSAHAVAKAITEAASKFSLGGSKATGVELRPAGGFFGRVDGRDYLMGPVGWIAGMGVSMEAVEGDIRRLRDDGKVLWALAEKVEGRLLGLFGFQDVLRTEARQTVRALRERGVKVGVISSETELVSRGAVQGMAVDFLKTGVRAGDKGAAVAELRALARSVGHQGRRGVAVIGDDAADLRIGVGTGATGDVVVKGLAGIPEILELSWRTMRIVRQNFMLGLLFHLVAIPLAMAGILSPMIAVVAVLVVTLMVVWNSSRVKRMHLGGADDAERAD